MCRDAVDQCRGLDATPSTRGYERGKRCTKGAAQLAIDKSNFTVARSCNQNAKTIGDACPCSIATLRRDLAQTEISDEAAEVQCERTHLSSRIRKACARSSEQFQGRMAPYPNWRQVAKTSRHRKRRFEHHYLAAVATKPIADVSLSSAAKTGRMRCSDSAWTDLRSNCLLQYLKRAVSIIVG